MGSDSSSDKPKQGKKPNDKAKAAEAKAKEIADALGDAAPNEKAGNIKWELSNIQEASAHADTLVATVGSLADGQFMVADVQSLQNLIPAPAITMDSKLHAQLSSISGSEKMENIVARDLIVGMRNIIAQAEVEHATAGSGSGAA